MDQVKLIYQIPKYASDRIKTTCTNPVSSLMSVLSENELSVGRVDGQREV